MTFNLKLSLNLLAAGFSLSYLAASAQAACVSNDCSALGYNKSESACSGDIIRCPFDTSKVFCKEKPNAEVGMIYYSDGTISKDILSGKTPIGVVALVKGNQRLAVALTETSIAWGGEGHNVSCLPDYNYESGLDKKTDINGKSNTKCLVNDSQPHPAASYCNNLKAASSGYGSSGWYLPAAGELSPILLNRTTINTTMRQLNKTELGDFWYKSSTEYNENYAWLVRISEIMNYAHGKNSASYSVRCIIDF